MKPLVTRNTRHALAPTRSPQARKFSRFSSIFSDFSQHSVSITKKYKLQAVRVGFSRKQNGRGDAKAYVRRLRSWWEAGSSLPPTRHGAWTTVKVCAAKMGGKARVLTHVGRWCGSPTRPHVHHFKWECCTHPDNARGSSVYFHA